MNISEAIETVGESALLAIAGRLKKAKAMHPNRNISRERMLVVIGEEYGELCHAVLDESVERQKDETLDVIVTAIRFYEACHDLA